jgi:hypothetical protein
MPRLLADKLLAMPQTNDDVVETSPRSIEVAGSQSR